MEGVSKQTPSHPAWVAVSQGAVIVWRLLCLAGVYSVGSVPGLCYLSNFMNVVPVHIHSTH